MREFLYDIDSFKYKEYELEKERFHLSALSPFLYFAHSQENYEALSDLIYK